MDYTKTSIGFKLQKIFRYTKLYGISRTLVKVSAQIHNKQAASFAGEQWINKSSNSKHAAIALIGCGNFAFSTIAYFLKKQNKNFLKYTLDTNKARALSLCKKYQGYCATTNYDDILNDEDIKLIYIASNHASHCEYAIKAIQHKKHVHIEKPHAINIDQLNRLIATAKQHPDVKLFMGFNRPKSPLFLKLKNALAEENGPTMMNWFVAGHVIEDGHWYYQAGEGGRALGNLCHWSDMCLHLVGSENAFPCVIQPAGRMNSKSDFAVTITFADQSVAAITFSVKGHTFEGIREYLIVHKGNILASLNDFQILHMDYVNKRYQTRLRYRDHGHQKNIINSYQKTFTHDQKGEGLLYIYQTGLFILKIQEAIETNQQVVCHLEDYQKL